MVTISKTAVEKLNEVMIEEGISPETHNLRVGVLGGGCSGLSYEMDFDDVVEESDTLVELETFNVVINKPSLLYLIGTELNFQGGLNGKGFEWINPNASRTCGCGESFSL